MFFVLVYFFCVRYNIPLKLHMINKQLLIIRSVSFQQLDSNIKKIVQEFPGHEIHILTHSHGVLACKNYESVSHVIDYSSRKNFSIFHLPPGLPPEKSRHYEAVIVPVTNKTGAGFLNVLLLALRIPTEQIYLCNLVSDIPKISKGYIIRWFLKSCLYRAMAVLLSIPLFLVFIPGFLIFLLFNRKKGA